MKRIPPYELEIPPRHPVTERQGFRHILPPHRDGVREIGDAARDAQGAGVASRRQAQPFGGLFGQRPGFGLQLERGNVGLGVVEAATVRAPRALRGAGAPDAGGDALAGLAAGGAGQFGRGHRHDFDGEVDAVQHGAADLALVVLAAAGRAAAFARGVAEIAAAARIHGGDHLEAGWVGDVRHGAGDGGAAAFHRLAQSFQRLAGKLRYYVATATTR